jgi:hypothetical protein
MERDRKRIEKERRQKERKEKEGRKKEKRKKEGTHLMSVYQIIHDSPGDPTKVHGCDD